MIKERKKKIFLILFFNISCLKEFLFHNIAEEIKDENSDDDDDDDDKMMRRMWIVVVAVYCEEVK